MADTFDEKKSGAQGKTKGLLITFEGIDFAGKTTQIELLIQALEDFGHRVLLVREPGGTLISEKIRRILLDPTCKEMDARAELLLYSASRAQLVWEKVLPALEKGQVVVCDRFYDSSMAYQGYGRELDLDVVASLNRFAAFGLVPDVTFFLDLEPDVASVRQKERGQDEDRLEASSKEFFARVRNGYYQIADDRTRNVIKVDAKDDPEVLHQRIWGEVKPLIASHNLTVNSD
jgi:dTMP kinase